MLILERLFECACPDELILAANDYREILDFCFNVCSHVCVCVCLSVSECVQVCTCACEYYNLMFGVIPNSIELKKEQCFKKKRNLLDVINNYMN